MTDSISVTRPEEVGAVAALRVSPDPRFPIIKRTIPTPVALKGKIMPEFPCNGPISIQVSITSGSVDITTEVRDTVNVVVTPAGNNEQSRAAAEATEVIFEGDKLTVEAPENSGRWLRGNASIRVDVQAPVNSNAQIGVASASVKCRGRYGQIEVGAAAGDVEIEEVEGDASIGTASGDIRVSSVGGQLEVATASGDLTVTRVDGTAQLKTASGDFEITETGSDVHHKSASGDLQIGAVHRGTLSASTASGEVSIAVVPDTGVWLDLDSVSGSINNVLDTPGSPPDAHDLSIQVRTVSGDIDILRTHSRTAV